MALKKCEKGTVWETLEFNFLVGIKIWLEKMWCGIIRKHKILLKK